MTSIFPGGNAFKASNITNKQQSESAEIMEKISHGKRLVSGADDAGNIFNVNNLKAKVLSTKASIRNVTDIMSMAQLAEQGYKNINNMLLRANELALQSTNKIYKDADRIAINNEIQNIINEIDNNANGVTFANSSLINGARKQINSDIANARSGELSLNINNIETKTLGAYSQSTLSFSSDVSIETFDGTDQENFIFEDVSSNSNRLIDLGKSILPSGGTAFFSGSHIDLSLNDSEANNETTKLRTVAVASTTRDRISVVGNKIFVGNGNSTDHIATIDGTLDGSNGQKLRLNIEEPSFTNGDFESANNLEGWSLEAERAFLDGTFTINQKPTPIDPVYPNFGAGGSNNVAKGITDQDTLVNEGTMSGGITTTQVNSGSKAVRLTSQNLRDTSGHSVIRGPYLYSNSSVTLGTASSVSFAWRAEGGGDAYDVYAYLVDVNNPSNTIELLNETQNSSAGNTNWATRTVNINEPGTYQFVFVSGSYDYSGGHVLGAQLFIDDIAVTNAARKLSGSVIENIGSLLYGEVDSSSNNGLSLGSTANSLQNGITSGQEVEILGTQGKKQINVKNGDIAELIAKKINSATNETGVDATSTTQVMLSFENTSGTDLNDTVSFSLYGIDGTMKKISSKLDFGSGNQDMNLEPLKTEINKFSGQTGITAYLSDDKQAITLKTRQGFDIKIEDFNLNNDDNNVSMYLNEMKSSGQISPCSLKLSQSSSSANANDSARIFGEVVLKSHKHFTLNSSQNNSMLSLRETNLNFDSLSEIAARSFETAKNSIDIIKYSLRSVSAEQSKVGGLSNQLQKTLDNLSKSSSLDKIAVGRLEDIDVPKAVVSLQKSNYIQSIATAMVNRVKSTMEAILQILDR